MNKNKTAYIKRFSTYFVVDAVNKALPFLILPVIAAYLTTAEYGLVSNFSALVQIASAFVALNTYTKLTTDYFKNKDKISHLFSNLANLIFAMTIIIFIIIILLNNEIYKTFHISIWWQIISVITASSMAFVNLYTSLLRMQKHAIKYGIVQFTQSFSFFGLSILFVAVFLWSWKGSLLSSFMSYTVLALIVFFIVCKYKIYKFHLFDKRQIWIFFLWGIPLLPHTLSFWLKFGVDKIMISNYISLSDNGIYSLALTLGSALSLVNTSFFNTYSPYVYRKLFEYDETDEKKQRFIIARLMKNSYIYLIGTALISIIAYFILAFSINIFFKGDYLKAIPMLPYTLLINFITSIYTIYSVFLFYRNRTKTIGTITFSSAVLQVVLNFLLIPRVGVYGALYSGIISATMMSLTISVLSFREYKIKLVRL